MRSLEFRINISKGQFFRPFLFQLLRLSSVRPVTILYCTEMKQCQNVCILVDKSPKESVGAPDQMTVNPTQQVGGVIPTPLSGMKKYLRQWPNPKKKMVYGRNLCRS